MRVIAEGLGALGLIAAMLIILPPTAKILISVYTKYYQMFLPKDDNK